MEGGAESREMNFRNTSSFLISFCFECQERGNVKNQSFFTLECCVTARLEIVSVYQKFQPGGEH